MSEAKPNPQNRDWLTFLWLEQNLTQLIFFTGSIGLSGIFRIFSQEYLHYVAIPALEKNVCFGDWRHGNHLCPSQFT